MSIKGEQIAEYGLTESSEKENFTFDDVFALAEQKSSFPEEGRDSIQDLKQRFHGTIVLTEILESPEIPEGTVTVEDLYIYSDHQFHTMTESLADNLPLAASKANEYRLAAQIIDPSIPKAKTIGIPVGFTSEITDPNQFIVAYSVTDRIEDNITNIRTRDASGHISVTRYQYKLCTLDETNGPLEKDALAVANITEYRSSIIASEENMLIEEREVYALVPSFPWKRPEEVNVSQLSERTVSMKILAPQSQVRKIYNVQYFKLPCLLKKDLLEHH